MKRLIVLLVVLLLTAACGSVQPTASPAMPNIASPLNTPAAEHSPIATPTVSITPTVGVTPMTANQLSSPPDIVNLAKTDLARRLGISTDEIVLVSTTVDEFPGENFGCPDRFATDSTLPGKQIQPESGVSPAFVTGTEIVLDVPSQATLYTYRGKGSAVVLCMEKRY